MLGEDSSERSEWDARVEEGKGRGVDGRKGLRRVGGCWDGRGGEGRVGKGKVA